MQFVSCHIALFAALTDARYVAISILIVAITL